MKAWSRRRVKRIGIFGGSFDPPHLGHLIIAEQARVQLKLDRVLFVPAFVPPHKSTRSRSSPSTRRALVSIAVRDHPGFSLSAIELERKGLSFTIDTLKELAGKFPHARLFLILGADNAKDFRSWKNPDEILKLATLAVYARTGSRRVLSRLPVLHIEGPGIDLSSTQIRRRIRKGASVRYLVPSAVERFIIRKRLYR